MKTITAKEFDEKFDKGEDLTEYLDFSNAMKLKDIKKLKTETRKVNVDFPEWIIEALDNEAKKNLCYKTVYYKSLDCRETKRRSQTSRGELRSFTWLFLFLYTFI
jgi:hypothetical protein